ncbi:MAG: D-alanine-D-alanine ligase [Methylophilaceae bacterium]
MEAKKFGRVAVLMGGRSNERDISFESGNAVLEALLRKKIDAIAIDPKIDELKRLKFFDRAFICLHGQDGEDGKIQTFLESINLPYTGSGILPSSLGMDKFKCKTIWKAKNISTPVFMQVNNINQFKKASNLCGLPFFLKPANSGSSIGIAKVNNEKEFIIAFEKAYKIDKIVIVESSIIGSEYSVPIIHNRPFPIIEIRTKTDFYDYEAKYIRDDTEFICPADVSTDVVESINIECVEAFNAIGCDGWGRVDFIIDKKNKIHIIEINTVPGMTNHSLVPMSASKIGIEFDDLVIMILETSNV